MNNLPIEDLEEIFLRVGQASYEELNELRLVCKAWNESIKKKLRAKNPSAEWGRIIASRVKRRLESFEDPPLSVAEITRAASLAHQGHLGSVEELWLDVNLSSIPADHLASLVSRVKGSVCIENVNGCDLITILDSVKSKCLSVWSQSLDSEETRALVRAMESRVEEVGLYEEVTLDIKAMTEYSGQGKCWVVVMFDHDTKSRYEEDLRTLAQNRNWQVNEGSGGWFEIHKKRYI